MELLTKIDFWPIMIIALITTLIVSAICNTFDVWFTKGKRKKFLVVITAAVITFTHSYDGTWKEILQTFLFSWSFAILFYSYLGGWFINWLFKTIKSKLIGRKK